MIPPDPEAIVQELGRKVTVAEVPRNLDKMCGVRRFDFHQVFGFCQDLYEAAIFEFQSVSVTKVYGCRFVQKNSQTLVARQNGSAAMSIFSVERYLICGLTLPVTMRMNLGDPDHCAASTFAFIALKPGRDRKSLK